MKNSSDKISPAEMQDIFERITDAFIALDKNWCYTYMNKKAGEVFNRNPKEMIGKHIWTEFPEAIDQSSYKAYYRAMEAQQYIHAEEYYRPHEKWFENQIYPSLEGLSIFFRDITERKKLEEQQALFTSIVNSTDDAVISKNLEGIITSWNKGAEKKFGYSLEEISGKHISILIPPHLPNEENEIMAKVRSGKSVDYYETERIRKDGKIIHVSLTISPIRDLMGNIIGASKISRDITEKKKLEDLLDKSNRLAKLGNWEADLIKGTVYWSAVTKEIHETETSFVPDLSQGLNFYKEGKTRDRITQCVQACIEHGTAWDEELQIITAKGNLKWIKTIGNAEFIDGKCIRFYGSFQDIDERKKAEAELKKNELRFQAMVENDVSSIALFDKDLKLVYRSPSAQRIVGWTNEEFQQHGPFDKLHPDDVEIAKKGFAEVFKKPGVPIKTSTRILHKNGSYVFMEGLVTNLLANENVKAIVFNVQDVTERKKAEDKTNESEEKYRSLIENSPDIIMLIDLDEKVQFINYTEGGFTKEQIIGTSLYGFVMPEFHELVRDTHKKVISNKTSQSYETAAIGQDGIKRWFFTHVGPIIMEEKVTALTLITRDITERKKVELIIRESEEKYRDLVDNIQDLICTHDLEGRILSVNPAATKLLGYSKDETLNLNLRNIIVPAFRHKFDDYLAHISKNGNANGLMHIQTSSGETRIWEYNNTLRTQGVDKPIVRGLSRDITERKKAEEDLHESEERFRALYEENPLMNFTIAADGKILSVNKCGAEQLGYSIQELLGSTVLDVFNKEDHPVVITQLKECLSNPNKSFSWSLRKITKSKETIWVSETGTAIKDRHGNSSVLIVCENITKRKKNEEEKLQAEKKYRLLFENNIAGIYRTTFAGEVLECNNAMAKFFGYDSADDFKRNNADLLYYSPDDRKEYLKLLSERKALYNYEITLKRKDGSHIHLLENILLTESIEHPEGIIEGVSIDITERKKAQDEVEHTSQQLRQLTAHLQNIREEERKRIGREIHDDLGQQLTAIKMDVAWIDKKTTDQSSIIKPKLKNIISLLDGSNVAVRKILNELRADILDNYGLLEALEWQGQQFTANTGIPVLFSSSETILKTEEAMATCIYRAYQEALTNITRYAKAKKVVSSLNYIDEQIILEIKDDGKGFDTTQQIGTQSFGILGIKERVASLNGTFELISSPGKGTKIIISLPFKL